MVELVFEREAAAEYDRAFAHVTLSLLSNQIGGCVRPFGIPTIAAIIL
jgi:hypothetical protein